MTDVERMDREQAARAHQQVDVLPETITLGDKPAHSAVDGQSADFEHAPTGESVRRLLSRLTGVLTMRTLRNRHLVYTTESMKVV